MKITLSRLSFAVVLALSLPLAATAAPKKEAPVADATKATETAAKPKAKGNNYPLYGQLTSINSKTLTLKGGAGKEDRKYAITESTQILKDGKPATFDAATVGQWVGGYVEKSTEGSDKVLKLNLSAKQKVAKPVAEKATAKPVEAKADPAPKKKAA